MQITPRKKRVLLVDDDLAIEAALDTLLHQIDPGIETDWATNAEDAFAKLEEASKERGTAPYDLIIADIFLDGKVTGVDLWQLCQNVYPEMPGIVMSGLPMHKFFDFMGENDICPPFLQKPLKISKCREAIQGLLE